MKEAPERSENAIPSTGVQAWDSVGRQKDPAALRLPIDGLFLGLLLIVLALTPAFSARADDDRSITVTGVAERRVAPDMATLNMTVLSEAPEVSEARRSADATVARALEALRGLDIANGDIDSSSLQVSPQYRWREEQRDRQLTGYQVRRSLTVRLTDLDRLGEVLVALTDAGVNELQPPQLGLQDSESLYRETLAAAAVNARERAEVMAATLGEELDGVLHAATHNSPRPVPRQREAAMMAADAGDRGAGYQSGDLNYRVQLTVTFALES